MGDEARRARLNLMVVDDVGPNHHRGLSFAGAVAARNAAGPAAAADPDAMMMQADYVQTRRPVMRQEVDWTMYPQAEDDPILPDGAAWCLFTHFAQCKDDLAQNDSIVRLRALIDKNRASMPPFDFCRMVQDFYNKNIRKNLMDPKNVKERKHGPAWSAESIWNYQLTGVLTPSATNETVARVYMDCVRVMSNNVIQRVSDPDGLEHTEVDPKTLCLLLKTTKEMMCWLDRAAATRNTDLM